MRRGSGSIGSLPCHWGPSPPVWTDKALSVMDTLLPLPGRILDHAPQREDFCPASCLRWAIPHWKVDLNFWLYISWQMTVPARQFPCHQRHGPLERSPPERPRVAIPAQDSLRTTEVPYNRFSCFARRTRFFGFRLFTIQNLWARSVRRLCAVVASTALFTHGFASLSEKRHKFLSHLAPCLSVCLYFHVTWLNQFLIGQTGCDGSAACALRQHKLSESPK